MAACGAPRGLLVVRRPGPPAPRGRRGAGDTKSALDMHLKMLPIFKDLFIEPNPVPVKTALSWRGAMSAECRLPLCEMSAANQARFA